MGRAPSTPIRMVGTVFITCLLSATALAFTYEATRDRIAAQERIAEQRALSAVLASGERFERLEDDILAKAEEHADKTPVTGAWRAYGADDAFVGFAIRLSPRGYGGPVHMVVGLDRDGKVAGVNIVQHRETPGLGTKIITEQWFGEQFIGWSPAELSADLDAYDTIKGATKSADAVRDGIVAAINVYDGVLQGVEDEGGEGR